MQWWLLCCTLACGCNQFYGLDDTQPILSPSDLDRDGVGDDGDNCPEVANSDQKDSDDDGIGDACDLCPGVKSTNHDEDSDTRGDECDLCPTVPNFELDRDGDGIGDDCDNDDANQNAIVVFDPFVGISDVWRPLTMPWTSSGDTAIPHAVDTALEHTTARVVGTQKLWIEIGLNSVVPWQVGDRFGFELVDPNTEVVLVSCIVSCDAAGQCRLRRFPAAEVFPDPAVKVPSTVLHFRHTDTLSACVLDNTSDSEAKIAFGEAKLRLVGSPNIHVRYVMMWQ